MQDMHFADRGAPLRLGAHFTTRVFTMRRYFFDVRLIDSLALDLVGDVLADDSSALKEARKAACELAAGAIRRDRGAIAVAVRVRDETDRQVGSVDVVQAAMRALGVESEVAVPC
jgi:hypothetical protein